VPGARRRGDVCLFPCVECCSLSKAAAVERRLTQSTALRTPSTRRRITQVVYMRAGKELAASGRRAAAAQTRWSGGRRVAQGAAPLGKEERRPLVLSRRQMSPTTVGHRASTSGAA
jgi:hypothetical protein